MALPVTGLKLSQICAEISGVQNSLQDCVDDTNTSGLNGTYYSSPLNSQRDFRGYTDATVYSSCTLSTLSYGSVPDTCMSYDPGQTLYFNGAGGWPVAGDTIYTTSAGTTTFNGQFKYWKLPPGQGNAAILIDYYGLVYSFTSCL